MTASTPFGFDEEAQLLRQNARKLLAEASPVEALHRLVAADKSTQRSKASAWDVELWQRMVELGWTAVAVPESAGGLEMKLVAIAGLAEEIGRAALPSPLITTLCSTYVLAACDGDASREALGRVAEGAAMTLGLCDHRGSWERCDTDVRAVGGTNVVLDGTAHFVQDARKAGAFIIKARSEAGLGLYLVEADAPGVTIVPDAIIDLTRDQAHVELRGVVLGPERVLATGAAAERALRRAESALLVVVSADMVGAAEWQLQTTTEYARVRVQFERPLGFFQAVKHPLVDMMIEIDQARSLVYAAAARFDDDPDSAIVLARMAKSAASDAASFCSGRSIQLHGGIGFTWECFVQLYFKRQKHNEVLFGDGVLQRAKLADILIGEIGATSP
jgi:alkylation response protein AidB-like acyl-CoA dehydrogenase